MNQHTDLSLAQMMEEALYRWFRPIEVCGILMNSKFFKLEEEPPQKPQGGSFFLFDRRAVRYFRKDGHSWRKRKDGKTVREAHERLKAGSKEVLHCYYAHGEENEHFQRRSYWLLERDMEHIVFVHYRDVKKENKTQSFQPLSDHVEGSYHHSHETIPLLPEVLSLEVFNQVSSPSASEHSLPIPSPHYDGCDSSDDPEQCVLSDHERPGSSYQEGVASGTDFKLCSENAAMDLTDSALFCAQTTFHQNFKMTEPSTWEISAMPGSMMVFQRKETMPLASMQHQKSSLHDCGPLECVSDLNRGTTTQQSMAAFGARKMVTGSVICSQENASHIKNFAEQLQRDSDGHMCSEQSVCETFYQRPVSWTKSEDPNSHSYQMQECDTKLKQKQDFFLPKEQNRFHALTSRNISNPLYSQIFKDFQDDSHFQQEEQENLKKIDSFRRCITQDITASGETNLLEVSAESATHFSEAFNGKAIRSENSQGTQLSVGLSLSLPRRQCFGILDFSPEYAFSTVETKVLITGEFLDSIKDTTECKWCCVFGNVEVAAELVCPSVLRTKAPCHAPGTVPLFITKGDGLACSDIREFCYLAGSEPLSKSFTTSSEICLKQDKQDMLFRIRFSMLLSAISQCHSNTPTINTDDEWTQLEHASICEDFLLTSIEESLVEKLQKEKLQELQISNVLKKGELTLDRHGLGILHMGAALGYDWVIEPLLSSRCVNINFRDAQGWTALHWAAKCGRERTVVALLAVGADPGVKTDPTPDFPAGQTPADLASRWGHKGIAGYLAESSLTGHLSTLAFRDGKMGKLPASMADRNAVETVSERTSIKFGSPESEGHATMQDSLAAMRNATQAAARIQFALRALSFGRRQEAVKVEEDEYGISDDQLHCMLAAKKPPKLVHSAKEDHMQSAAIRIQQKFRSWKGRKDFLLFRQRVVRIQAHVRGHQVRQQYKKITWSVGILEKAILRWRRKGKGLRGFHRGTCLTISDENNTLTLGEDDFLKAGRKQIEAGIEKALARVHSMVKSSEAREQYRRLLNGYELAKVHLDTSLSLEDVSQFKETSAAEYTSCITMSEL
eukprot:c607_g1_i1 orf=185-3403(+)